MARRDRQNRKRRFGTLADRIFAALLFVGFSVLIYLAATGRFDHEIGQFSRWLKNLLG
ncbi:MAG: hypothetical protein KDI75_09030 [Xanthomonadales bacterium]|nr:hypothetical protein [Xanthomonadales bacterium]